MKISAQIPSVTEVEIEITPNSTVSKLKKILCTKLSIEPDLTKLLLNGKPLKDDWKVSKLRLESKKLEIDYFWSRQMILWGQKGQTQLRNSRVLIAGAGAIGNEAAKNLAMLGVGKFTIVDYDLVEVSNLSRMLFFDKTDSGKSKSAVLAKKLHKRYPHIEIIAVQGRLENLPLNIFLDSDIIISGLDNFASRVFLTSISRRYLIPLIDGGIAGYQCRIQTYVPPADPCPLCPILTSQYGKLVGLRNPCDAPIEEVKIPSLPTTISLVASIQTQEVAKILLGYSDFLKTGKWPETYGRPMEGIWLADLKYNKYSILSLARNKNCLVCGEHGESRDTVIRIEIPLNELVLPDNRTKIITSLFSDTEEVLYFRIWHGKFTKIAEHSLRKVIKKGDYLLVTLKRKSGEYNEAIARLT